MPIIEGLDQGSKKWLDYRQTRIMATDSGIILGSNHYKTRLQLYEEKLEITLPSLPNKAMLEGIKREPEARALANSQIGIYFEPYVFEDDERPWMASSLDGFSECTDYILEIKCPSNPGLHHSNLMEIIPPYYYDQIQHQLLTTGAISAFYCTYFPENKENPICIREYRPNLEKQAEIIAKGSDFYFNHLCVMNPPEDWKLKVNNTLQKPIYL